MMMMSTLVVVGLIIAVFVMMMISLMFRGCVHQGGHWNSFHGVQSNAAHGTDECITDNGGERKSVVIQAWSVQRFGLVQVV